LLDSLGEIVKTRGVVVKSFFRDFDRSNSGAVTRAQFEREIRRCFPALVDSDVAVLIKRYGVPGSTDVRYRDLHNDVTPSPDGQSAISGRLRKIKVSGGPIDVDAVGVLVHRILLTCSGLLTSLRSSVGRCSHS
jgi:hypothetical protein